MAVTKVNARDWTVEINTGTEGVPTWVQIGGLTSFTVENSEAETDDTTFDSAGIEEQVVMQRGKQLSIEGKFLEDEADGSRNAGQAAVEAAADDVGEASKKQYRFTSPGGTIETAKFTTRLGSIGGGNNDRTSWAATLKRSGASTIS